VISLCCSQVVRSRLGITGRPSAAAEPTTRLGNWYVHLVHLGPRQLVLATSERSLLTVILPASELRATIEGNLRIAVEQLLSAMNIPMDIVNRELAQMQPVSLSRQPTAGCSDP
jgi:hypothetical protein